MSPATPDHAAAAILGGCKAQQMGIPGGQAWSWLTPNRVGMRRCLPTIFYAECDANYRLGLIWTRAPQVRVLFHANDHWAWELPWRIRTNFAGQAGTSQLPSRFINAL